MRTLADDICLVKSMHTEAMNHDPGIAFVNTGNQLPGYVSVACTSSTGAGDHLGRCFSIWLAGGGIKPGITLRINR
jgi:Protein of unknown function (DUF1501)